MGWLLRDRLRDSLAFLISLPGHKAEPSLSHHVPPPERLHRPFNDTIILPEDEPPVDEDTDIDLVEDRLVLLSLPVRKSSLTEGRLLYLLEV